ncbi:MAG TPA: hypothetical protein VGB82_01505 [Alphaproteobacteria bacterium]
MNWFAQADQSGYWDAYIEGLGKENGIQIAALQGGPKIQTIPQVAAGQAEFGIGNADRRSDLGDDTWLLILLHRVRDRPIAAPPLA